MDSKVPYNAEHPQKLTFETELRLEGGSSSVPVQLTASIPEFEVLHESGSAKAPVQWMGYINLTSVDQFGTRFSDQAMRDMIDQHTVPNVTFSHSGQTYFATHSGHAANLKTAWDVVKRTMAEQSEQMIVNPDDMLDAIKEHAIKEQRAAVEHGIITGAIEVNQWIPKGTAVKIKHPGAYCRCGNCRKQGCGSTESVWDAHLRQECERREALKNSRTGTPDVIKIAIEIQEDAPAEATNQAAVTQAPESPQPRSSRLLTELKHRHSNTQMLLCCCEEGSVQYYEALGDIHDLETAIAAFEPNKSSVDSQGYVEVYKAAAVGPSVLQTPVKPINPLEELWRELLALITLVDGVFDQAIQGKEWIPSDTAGIYRIGGVWVKLRESIVSHIESIVENANRGGAFGILAQVSEYLGILEHLLARHDDIRESFSTAKGAEAWIDRIAYLAEQLTNEDDIRLGIARYEESKVPDKIALKIQEVEKALSHIEKHRANLYEQVKIAQNNLLEWYNSTETSTAQDEHFAQAMRNFQDFIVRYEVTYLGRKVERLPNSVLHTSLTNCAAFGVSSVRDAMKIPWDKLHNGDSSGNAELETLKNIRRLVKSIESERNLKHVLNSLKEQQAASYPANPQHYDNNDE